MHNCTPMTAATLDALRGELANLCMKIALVSVGLMPTTFAKRRNREQRHVKLCDLLRAAGVEGVDDVLLAMETVVRLGDVPIPRRRRRRASRAAAS